MKKILLLMLLFSVGKISAQCTLDQNQPQWDGGTSERNLPGYYDWQSFTAGMSGALCQVDVMFCNSGAVISGTGSLEIFDGTGDGGMRLDSEGVSVNGSSAGINSPFWMNFTLSNPPAVVSGQVYTWKFTPVQGGGLPDPYLIQVYLPDIYSGGVSYNFGTGGDITFATHVDPAMGVHAISNENDLSIYPVPANDVIHLESAVDLSGRHYFVFDAEGRIVMNGELCNGTINVSSLEEGIYFLRVGENDRMRKIIIR